MRPILLGLGIVGILVAFPALASRIGFGLGASEFGFAGAELVAEFRPEEALSWRVSLLYLAPVLPAESPVVSFLGGLRWASGEVFRPFLAGLGGIAVEPQTVGWALGGVLGVEWRLERFALYLSGAILFSSKPSPYGTVFYPYTLYTLGLFWKR